MSVCGCIILETESEWRFSRTDRPDWQVTTRDSTSIQDLATQIAAYVDQEKLSPEHIGIGISADSVLAATLDINHAETVDRQMMEFELEQCLPWDAEQTVSDFLTTERNTLGIGIHADRWLPLVIALESRQLHVQSLTPTFLLAMQEISDQSWYPAEGGIVWSDESRTHIVRIERGRPIRWRVVGSDPAGAIRETIDPVGDPLMTTCWTLVNTDSSGWDAALLPDSMEVSLATTAPVAESARQRITGALDGSAPPWFELRRDVLTVGDPFRAVGRAFKLMLATLALLLLSCVLTLGVRAVRYHRAAESAYEQEADVFRELFPTGRIPAAVLSRLKSEHTRRLAARHVPKDVPFPVPALAVLKDFLAALPSRQRLQISEARIEDGQLDLDVRLLSHAAANDLADALRAHGFSVPAPTSEQNEDQSVSARLFATWNGSKDDKQESVSNPPSGAPSFKRLENSGRSHPIQHVVANRESVR